MAQTEIGGLVATTPRFLETTTEGSVASFRLAEKGPDGLYSYNWWTVIAQGQLAHTVMQKLTKGDKITTFGNIHIRDWTNGDSTGTSVEIDSITITKEELFTPEAHDCSCKFCDTNKENN